MNYGEDQNIEGESAKGNKLGKEFKSQQVNPLDIGSSDSSITGILEQSQKYAEELEMKMDKCEDMIELKKEEQLHKNLENPSKFLFVKISIKMIFSTSQIN